MDEKNIFICDKCKKKIKLTKKLEEDESNSPYKPIGRVIQVGNSETEVRDSIIVIIGTLTIVSIGVLVLSYFN
jgi:hypothetical protein